MVKPLGQSLVEADLITETQLEDALRLQQEKSGFLGHILLEEGWINEQQLCQVISEALNVNCVRLDDVLINEDVIELISNSLALTCHILPLFVHHDMLYLAMENPYDTGVIQLVEYETGMQVRPLIAPPYQLREMIGKYYHIDDSMGNMPKSKDGKDTVEVNRKISRRIGFGQRKRLGRILIEAGLLSEEQVEVALNLQEEKRGFLGQVIVGLGWITEEKLCQTLSEILQVESVNFEEVHIDPEVTKYVSDSLAASSNVFPLFMEDDTLYLAMENPLDSGILLYIQHDRGIKVKPLVAPPSQIRALIQKYYPSQRLPDSSSDDLLP